MSERNVMCEPFCMAQTFSVKSMGSLSNENQDREGQICFNLIELDLLFCKKGQRHKQNIYSFIDQTVKSSEKILSLY